MKKREYMAVLSSKLKLMPKSEREQAIEYYDEYISDSGLDDEADVTELLGPADVLAKKIITECTDKTIEESKDSSVNGNLKVIWLAILGICAAPIALPILFVLMVVMFVFVVVGCSLLFAAGVTVIGATVTFVAMIPGIFWASSLGQGLLIAGISCIGIAMGLILIRSIVLIFTWFIKLIALIFKKIFVRKKVA